MSFQEKFSAIRARFPEAKFVISLFKTIEEIETKILSSDDEIIVREQYDIYVKRNNKWIEDKKWIDSFIVKKKEGKEHIYYSDVLDELIRLGLDRTDTDHKYLEQLGEMEKEKRYSTSVKVFGLGWGS
jgi:hypothetical protein